MFVFEADALVPDSDPVVDAEGAVAVALGELATVVGVPPGVPGAVEAAEIVAELDSPSTSFSVMVKGELVARTSLMFETLTN